MTRLRRDLPAFAAVFGLAALVAAPAGAATVVKHRYHAHPTYGAHVAYHRAPLANFPVYVDHGSDYNPGSDNLYFSDTKTPHYIVGPAWFQRWNN